jgi:hypothetical protein
MSEHTIDLYLTNAQFKKMDNQKPFQVSFQQLNGNKPADHHVSISLEKKDYTKLQRNMRNKKGFRFSPQRITGHGLFDTGLSLLKKAASSKMVQGLAKQALSKGLEFAGNSNNGLLAGAANLAKGAVGGKCHRAKIRALQDMEGSGIFDTGLSLLKKAASSKMVQDLAKKGLNKGLQIAGNSNNGLLAGAANLAKGAVGGKCRKTNIKALQDMEGSGIFDTGLSLLKKAASSKMVQDLAKKGLNKGLQIAGNSNNGLISNVANLAKGAIGGKMKKGSIEAKEHMAKIRAMRKTGNGFNFLKAIKSVVKNPIVKQIGQTALKTALPMAMQIAKSNPYTAPLAMGTQAILQSQGVSTGGKLTGKVKKITMPEMIAMSNVRMCHPIESGGSFRALGV